MGTIGLATGFSIFNGVLMVILNRVLRKAELGPFDLKLAKAS